MKTLILSILFLMVTWSSTRDLEIARIRYIAPYYTNAGQYRSGHYKDTSKDGCKYNNANYLNLNRSRRYRKHHSLNLNIDSWPNY